jgi:hypothetical protein
MGQMLAHFRFHRCGMSGARAEARYIGQQGMIE